MKIGWWLAGSAENHNQLSPPLKLLLTLDLSFPKILKNILVAIYFLTSLEKKCLSTLYTSEGGKNKIVIHRLTPGRI